MTASNFVHLTTLVMSCQIRAREISMVGMGIPQIRNKPLICEISLHVHRASHQGPKGRRKVKESAE